MSAYPLSDVERARELVYLPPAPRLDPIPAGRPRLCVDPSVLELSRDSQGDWRGALRLDNPSAQVIAGHAIDWGQAGPFVRDREATEKQFVRRPIPTKAGGCCLEIVLDGAAANVDQTDFAVTLDARRDDEVFRAELILRLVDVDGDAPVLIAEPPAVAFGNVPPFKTREIAKPVGAGGQGLRLALWSPDGANYTHEVHGDDRSVAIEFGGDEAVVYYRWSEGERPLWTDAPLGRLTLTPVGLCSAAPREPGPLRVTIRSRDQLNRELNVLRRPELVSVKPESFRLGAGQEAVLDVAFLGDARDRSDYRGEIEIGDATAGRALIKIPVSAHLAPVGPIAQVTPEVLDYGYMSPDETRCLELELANVGTGELRVELGDLFNPVGFVRAELVNVDDRISSTKRVPLELDAKRLDASGPVEFDVPLKTNSHVLEQRSTTVRARAYVGELRCDPPDLSSLSVAYGDEWTLPCRVFRTDDEPVHLASVGLFLAAPSAWRVAAGLVDESTLTLHVQAPSDPKAPPFSGQLELRDGRSGLAREVPVVAALGRATAELSLVLTDPVEWPVGPEAVLESSDLRGLVLTLRNAGKPRLLIQEIGYRRQAGPRLRLRDVPTQPIEAGQTARIPVRFPWAWVRRVFREYRIEGRIYLRCVHHAEDVAAVPVHLRVVRKRVTSHDKPSRDLDR